MKLNGNFCDSNLSHPELIALDAQARNALANDVITIKLIRNAFFVEKFQSDSYFHFLVCS